MAVPSKKPASGLPSSFRDDSVKLVSYCPLCGSSYTPLETNVLGEKDDSHLLHIQCGNCSNAIIALIMMSSMGVSSVGLVTDLAHHEVENFKTGPKISTDDVIDTHHLLQNESMMFAKLGVA
jgi:hypothetical protein